MLGEGWRSSCCVSCVVVLAWKEEKGSTNEGPTVSPGYELIIFRIWRSRAHNLGSCQLSDPRETFINDVGGRSALSTMDPYSQLQEKLEDITQRFAHEARCAAGAGCGGMSKAHRGSGASETMQLGWRSTGGLLVVSALREGKSGDSCLME